MHNTPTDKMTVAELEAMPYDSRHHYELLDGQLVTHDRSEDWAAITLRAFFAGLSRSHDDPWPCMRMTWKVDEHNLFRPHITFKASNLRKPHGADDERPYLIAEVVDVHPLHARRMLAYARAGLSVYWAVDLASLTVTIYKLVDGVLVQDTTIEGDDVVEVDEPFPTKLCPARQLV